MGRKLGRPSVQGIRFRLGLAMAVALLPILMLAAVQTEAGFRRQAEQQRIDLQLAADRSAAEAKVSIDSAVVLLQALAPEGVGFYCEPRLTALVDRLDGIAALSRYSATGEPVCASRSAAVVSSAQTREQAWYQRLKRGEEVAMEWAAGEPGALIVGVRSERPLGAFQGAIAAVLPLTALQPDILDPALPLGSQAALLDASGRILTATEPAAFVLDDPRAIATWAANAQRGDTALFEARDARGRRQVYAGAPLSGRDVFVLLSAPAPGLLSWARLNPFGTLLLPLAAWLATFAAVMLLSERIVVRWLAYLERVAAIYARGRFSVRPVQAEHAPAEIRVLARTLGSLGETITRRDRALLEALDEKDALMREIHHRVKNNLQIISSLLSMQQRAVNDPAARAALGDTRQRIGALALIYRILYQSEPIREADSGTFLRELVGQLVAGAAVRGPLVTTTVEADPLVIDPDKLAPLALWLVEAVSNAQKHAFAERGGDLQVRFRVLGETSVLEVQDDGPGVADPASAGVGRTLMIAFAKQLRGEAELVPGPDGGCIARLTFATPQAQGPARIHQVAAFRVSGTRP
ncbi:sensor histidine kinase [Brevundimonas naejangsanensis]|uniref:histidine kinase n=2 Tax=Brevundimonas naejangsanensis TaxID=588932 RepID=A0A494RIM3_9CAUL|nr:sensor histidine kinase [Brevundimonas naejangsanensis]AYG96308.1 sensor histidine kinase [Brevundimonas naejangsanensis]